MLVESLGQYCCACRRVTLDGQFHRVRPIDAPFCVDQRREPVSQLVDRGVSHGRPIIAGQPSVGIKKKLLRKNLQRYCFNGANVWNHALGRRRLHHVRDPLVVLQRRYQEPLCMTYQPLKIPYWPLFDSTDPHHICEQTRCGESHKNVGVITSRHLTSPRSTVKLVVCSTGSEKQVNRHSLRVTQYVAWRDTALEHAPGTE